MVLQILSPFHRIIKIRRWFILKIEYHELLILHNCTDKGAFAKQDLRTELYKPTIIKRNVFWTKY